MRGVRTGDLILVGHRLGHNFPETSRLARRAHPTTIVPNRIAPDPFFGMPYSDS